MRRQEPLHVQVTPSIFYSPARDDVDLASASSKSRIFPIRIGRYGAIAIHGFQPKEASQVHVHCRHQTSSSPSSLWPSVQTAAVLDHRYIFSFLQLSTALHRLEQQEEEAMLRSPTSAGEAAASRRLNLSFLSQALSLSHNTKLLLDKLPCGAETAAAVIIWASSTKRAACMVGHDEIQMTESAVSPSPGTKRARSRDEGESSTGNPNHKNTDNFPCVALPPVDQDEIFLMESRAIWQAVREVSETASSHPLFYPPPIPPSSGCYTPLHYVYPEHSDVEKIKAFYAITTKVWANGALDAQKFRGVAFVNPASLLKEAIERETGDNNNNNDIDNIMSNSTTATSTSSSSSTPSSQPSHHHNTVSQHYLSSMPWAALEMIVVNKLATYDV